MGSMRRVVGFLMGAIRVRIMLAVVLVSGCALALSGLIVHSLQQRHAEDDATRQLQRVRARLELEVTQADPGTGAPFASVKDVLGYHLSRSVLSPPAGELAFVGDRINWIQQAPVRVRPEADPELMAAVRPHLSGRESLIQTITTSLTTYRTLVVPIRVGDEVGALVHVIDMRRATAELKSTMEQYTVVAVATVLALIVPAWLAMGRLLRPIGELRRATDAIDEHDLTTRVPSRGRDDLSALARAVNRMLDRVQATVEAHRRLLDDVSHELRTPITIVRGHLELLDVNDPEDVAETREVSIDELDRMGVLVQDLLVLAKANQADFINPESTELAELTLQVLAKARGLGERGWILEDLAEGSAWLDPARITQAWLQLAANAVKYSSPGSVIGIGSMICNGQVLFYVRDEGIGMTPEEMATVHERSVRGQSAAHFASGLGLGLSIVTSIAEAHGGRLEIESEEGQGSLFTLWLPLTPQEASGEMTRWKGEDKHEQHPHHRG